MDTPDGLMDPSCTLRSTCHGRCLCSMMRTCLAQGMVLLCTHTPSCHLNCSAVFRPTQGTYAACPFVAHPLTCASPYLCTIHPYLCTIHLWLPLLPLDRLQAHPGDVATQWQPHAHGQSAAHARLKYLGANG